LQDVYLLNNDLTFVIGIGGVINYLV